MVSYEVKKAYALNRERLTYDDPVEEDKRLQPQDPLFFHSELARP